MSIGKLFGTFSIINFQLDSPGILIFEFINFIYFCIRSIVTPLLLIILTYGLSNFLYENIRNHQNYEDVAESGGVLGKYCTIQCGIEY